MKKGGARRFFKSAFYASLLVSGIVSISFADPGNTGGGTQSPPGQASEHNPHGSPPGQGGSVPGNSGAHNPHGSPPGQRIGGSGVVGGGSPSSGGGGVSSPSASQSTTLDARQGVLARMGAISAVDVSSSGTDWQKPRGW